ncbi:MAG: ATP-binding protein [Acidimicrobiales bacterium]
MPVEAERRFVSDETSPSAARTFVAEMLQLWDCEDLEEVACLLTSELVSNAVIHAATEVVLRMELEPPVLRVEVADELPELPAALALTPDSEHGRGLHLIEALSRRWGSRPSPPGKIVWFELDVGGATRPEV